MKEILRNISDEDKESPFFSNTLLIANYYFDCTSYGFYGSKKPQKENGGIYGLKGDEIVITELKKKGWKSGLFVIKNELTLPLQSFDKILYFVIHQE